MGRYSKLPHGFLHTFFNSGPHFLCDTFVLCLNWVLPGIPFAHSPFSSSSSSFPLRLTRQEEEEGRERSAENQAGRTHVGGGRAGEGSATRSAAATLRSKFTQVNRFLLVCLSFFFLL